MNILQGSKSGETRKSGLEKGPGRSGRGLGMVGSDRTGASVVAVRAVWRIGQGPALDTFDGAGAAVRLVELLASQLPGQPAAKDSSGVSVILLHSHSFLVWKGPRGPRSHQKRC